MKTKMRYLLLILFILLFPLGSCKAEPSSNNAVSNPSISPSIAEKTDEVDDLFYDPSSFRQDRSASGVLVDTGQSIYYLLSKYIYYGEKGNPAFTILCGRPECKHNNEDCNAYIPSFSFSIFNDEIFYYQIAFGDGSHTIELWKMQLNGSQHEKVKDVFEKPGGQLLINGYFHEGYFYYPDLNVDLISTGYSESGIYRIALDKDSPLEKIIDMDDLPPFSENVIGQLTFADSMLYFTGTKTEGVLELWQYNVQTHRFNKILDNWTYWGHLITADTIYHYQPHDGFYELNVKDGSMSKVLDMNLDEDYGAYFSEDYILLIELKFTYEATPPTVYVYSRDYTLLNEFKLQSDDFTMTLPALMAITDEYIYFVETFMTQGNQQISYAIPVDTLSGDDVPIYQVNTYR